jgi:hypothetical protein
MPLSVIAFYVVVVVRLAVVACRAVNMNKNFGTSERAKVGCASA